MSIEAALALAVIAIVVIVVLVQHGKLSGLVEKVKAYESHIIPNLQAHIDTIGAPIIKVVPVASVAADAKVAAPAPAPVAAAPTPLPQIYAPAPVAVAPAPVAPAAPARLESEHGPLIAAAMTDYARFPGGAQMQTNIISYFCEHPECPDYAAAYKAVVIDRVTRDEYTKTLLAGQDLRDAAANVAGVDFNGSVPLAMLMPFADHLLDGRFLADVAGEFANKVGKSVWTEVLYGTATDCNAFINFVSSTNSGGQATFDRAAYIANGGMLAGIVSQKMNGG